MSEHQSLVRRTLHRFNLFTLMSFNPMGGYNSPHSGYASRPLSGPRVF